ncbi:RNA polymerase sigma factor RpoE [Minicystis rosea]|nr:RNA polymerase sigma factor RpoE [Minicystis rosea]
MHRASATSTEPPSSRRLPVVATFEHVFQDNAPFVWRALRRLGVPEADVEDVCQEVFMIVHRRLADFEGRSAVRTWIYGICVRRAASYRRAAHRRHEEIVDTVPEEIAPASQLDELGRRRAQALLDAALDRLDDDKRAVFVLFEIEEVPMTEVAEAVGCPLQTAYARLYAARKQVEASLRRAALSGGRP